MATRSTIAYTHPNGSVSVIYCHWDGYLDNNGAILLEHYRDENIIKQLCEGGRLSSLGPSLDECTYPDVQDETLFERYASFEEYQNHALMQQYNYIYKDGAWTVEYSDTGGKFVNLEEALAEQLYRETLEDEA